MAIATGGTAGDQKSAYEEYKQKMWEAFSRLSTGEKIATLFNEWWPYILFPLGWALAANMAHAQGRRGPVPPSEVVVAIYVVLLLILAGCVIFLLTATGRWGNVHNWAAKTATFLLGFLTKGLQDFS